MAGRIGRQGDCHRGGCRLKELSSAPVESLLTYTPHIKRGGGTGPQKPRHPPRSSLRGRCQVQQAMESLGDVKVRSDLCPSPQAEVFVVKERRSDANREPEVQGVRGHLPARGAIRVRRVLRAARGRL